MALGDGITWIETGFTNASDADTIDNEATDIRKGVRSRMAIEHEWGASQTGTGEAGQHKYLTLQDQATGPGSKITGTQLGAITIQTSGSGVEMFVACAATATTAGSDIQLTKQSRLQASIIRSSTADPASPIAGEIWFRSDL